VEVHICLSSVFIDDVIIFGKTYEEQLHNLQLDFDRIKAANLKLSPKKCEFFKRKVKFVMGDVTSPSLSVSNAWFCSFSQVHVFFVLDLLVFLVGCWQKIS
jgi:hypothetical protein